MAARLVILLGAPGAGKSVQSRRLAETKQWLRISTGELLRASSLPELGEILRSGQLAPSETVQDLLMERLGQLDDRTVILDGFPRMLSEARWLDDRLPELKLDLHKVVLLAIDRTESLRRLANRQRGDDDPVALEKRWQEFNAHTQPVIDHYRRAGRLVEVDGSGSVDQVFGRLEQVI